MIILYKMALQPNPYLVATSLTFLIPATFFAFQGQWLMYTSNVMISIISTLYHATKWPPLFYIDVCMANILTLLHLLYAIQMGYWYLPLPGIGYSILMFIYGHKYTCFVWHPSLDQATRWHISMHIVVVISVVFVSLI